MALLFQTALPIFFISTNFPPVIAQNGTVAKQQERGLGWQALPIFHVFSDLRDMLSDEMDFELPNTVADTVQEHIGQKNDLNSVMSLGTPEFVDAGFLSNEVDFEESPNTVIDTAQQHVEQENGLITDVSSVTTEFTDPEFLSSGVNFESPDVLLDILFQRKLVCDSAHTVFGQQRYRIFSKYSDNRDTESRTFFGL
ncbi:unnamed protein product [Gongylonema pulchrum]|uniref:Rad21_Rec8 domain-containing protein n=1 Tax=Gongylonema pulchrum TaxID=637853 RepID=A0A183DP22_9BILA|nr:unnamed protein product [Gongylonema pulchrum]